LGMEGAPWRVVIGSPPTFRGRVSLEDGNGGGGGSGSSAGAVGGGSVDGVRDVQRGGSGGIDGRRPPLPSVRMPLKR